MSGYPPPGSGYPYGGPQPYASSPYGASQPYGAPSAQSYASSPYGASQPYGASPAQSYTSSPYGASQPYGAPPTGPYGGGGGPQPSAPYGPPAGEKPSKVQQSGYQQPPSGGGYQQPPSGGGYQQPPSGGGYQQPPSGGGYQPSAPPAGAYGSPFASLVPSAFPPGTDPSVVACFQVADQDGSGFIDDKELQQALSSYNQTFSIRTVRLLMYLFTSSNVRRIGPKEFISVFYSLQNWRAIFERFDRDRSGKIDVMELRDALQSLGFAVSPVVLDLLVSKFDKTGGKNMAIEYDNFIECCLTVKGLTEKFKEKDVGFTGSATFTYDGFMLTVLPFLIA